jgi:hypothetical protein
MLRKIILLLVFLSSLAYGETEFSYAQSDISYKTNEKNDLYGLLSKKTAKLSQNLSINMDIASALVLVDDDFQDQVLLEKLKGLNPDKPIFTFSYTF